QFPPFQRIAVRQYAGSQLRSTPMRADRRNRLRHWLSWFVVLAVLVFAVTPSVTRSQQKPDADKPNESPSSSYDQIQPVLLGKEKFQDVMAKDKADKETVMARQT